MAMICLCCLRRIKFSSLLYSYLVRNLNSKGQNWEKTNDIEYSKKSTTHFGFDTVTEREKANRVYSVFSNVATKYDLMNDVMSACIHRLWKDEFIQILNPVPGTKLLDMAGGTGDIAFRFLKYSRLENPEMTAADNISNPFNEADENEQTHKNTSLSEVVVCDINSDMLNIGKERAKQNGFVSGISWIQGDAENLPFASDSFDAYTIAFGIRNVVHIDKVLSEAFRVLKKGGRFLCLEFSQVTNPLVSWIYDKYSFQVIPVLGQIIARDWRSYQYLVESIRQFPTQEEFCLKMKNCGFKIVTYENLLFGIAAIHSGFKI